MPKQKVTLEIDVPEGYEAIAYRPLRSGEFYLSSGDAKKWGSGCDGVYDWIILRKLPDPVEDWLKAHPWLPEGCWVYRFYTSVNCWAVGDREPAIDGPEAGVCTYSSPAGAFSVNAFNLAGLFGHTFTPPPVDLVQVKRPSKQEAICPIQ